MSLDLPVVFDVERASKLRGNRIIIQKGVAITVGTGQLRINSFDRDLALTECRNFERLMKIHLKRCNCPDTAKEISMILGKLAEGFANK